MRLFVALYPPPEAVDHLNAQVARLRIGEAAADGVGVRVADSAQAHVTLAFLAAVSMEQLMAVEGSLDQVARWSRDSWPAPPRLRLGGGGTFGQGRSTVLWVGLRGDLAELTELGQVVRSRLRANRLPYDEKPWHPHLTVARPGDRLPPADVAADVAALDAYGGPQWPARELVLTRSHPGRRPTHDRLAAWPL